MSVCITEYEIAQIMKTAYLKATTPSNISSGFAATGIFPFDPDKVTESECIQAASAVSVEQPITQNSDNVGESLNVTAQISSSVPPTSDRVAEQTTGIAEPESVQNVSTEHLCPTPKAKCVPAVQKC